jgi:uncharacterized protein YkuJ
MGRLTKKKIDRIAKLRSQGYTQIEVAEKEGVCLKTVRKYDPGSISGSAKEWRELQSLPGRVKNLEEVVKTLSALATSYQFEKDGEFVAWCPKCDGQVITKRMEHKKTKKSYYGCARCRTPIPYAKYFDGELADIST